MHILKKREFGNMVIESVYQLLKYNQDKKLSAKMILFTTVAMKNPSQANIIQIFWVLIS